MTLKRLGFAMAFNAMASACAWAQANANATQGATDAFGFRSGDDSVGIYDESSVRGFNLEAAGNYRVNGTYFVRNSGVSSFFLESTTVQIGYNTLGSIHPGPSGVVDYRRTFRGRRQLISAPCSAAARAPRPGSMRPPLAVIAPRFRREVNIALYVKLPSRR